MIMSERVVAEEKKFIPLIMYAIRDNDTGEVIWNARNYAYKSADKAVKKLNELRLANPEKRYSLVRWCMAPEIDWGKVVYVSERIK